MPFNFFRMIVPKDERDILFSDFEQLYENVQQEKGKLYATSWILIQIFQLF